MKGTSHHRPKEPRRSQRAIFTLDGGTNCLFTGESICRESPRRVLRCKGELPATAVPGSASVG